MLLRPCCFARPVQAVEMQAWREQGAGLLWKWRGDTRFAARRESRERESEIHRACRYKKKGRAIKPCLKS